MMSIDVDSGPVARPREWYDLLQRLTKNLGRLLLRRRIRNTSLVSHDYEQGRWRREQRRVAEFTTLEEFIYPQDHKPRLAYVDGRARRLTGEAYSRYRFPKMARLIGAEPGADLVELGCGNGRMLFGVAQHGEWSSLAGYDISPTAVASAQDLSDRFCAGRLKFAVADLRDPADPVYKALRGRTVFTNYCLEQLPYDTQQVLDNICAAGPKRVVHIEITSEMLRWWRLRELNSLIYARSQDFQASLISTLRKMETQKRIRLAPPRREWFAPSLQNAPVVVEWAPLT